MNRILKALAIIMLVLTVAGAGAVLYGIRTLSPKVVSVVPVVTPAVKAQEMFDAIMGECADGLFAGKVYGETDGLSAEECSFVTYSVRLKNEGFFPAEWIALNVSALAMDAGRDVLVLDNGGANVLPAGETGDLAVTLLTTIAEPQPPRTVEITCYVFGRKQTVRVQAQ